MKGQPGLLLVLTAALLLDGSPRTRSTTAAAPPDQVTDLLCRYRWVEGRIAECDAYHPWAVLGSGGPPSRTDPGLSSDRNLISVLSDLDRLRRMESPLPDRGPGRRAALYQRALIGLPSEILGGRTDEVLDQLVEAAASDQENPRIWSNLAAVRLFHAGAAEKPVELVRGLDAAMRALALPEPPRAAHFNRALLLEALRLPGAARRAWRDYLGVDDDSPWADEARFHLTRLAARADIIDTPPANALSTPEGFEKQALPELRSPDEDTGAVLTHLRRLASAAEAQTGDRLARDAVEAFAGPLRRRDRQARQNLLAAHGRLMEGYRAYQVGDLDQALRLLAAAKTSLEKEGDPFALWASFYQACALQQAERYRDSLALLAWLDRQLEGRSYRSLSGYVSWMLGQNNLLLGKPVESLGFFRASLNHFRDCALPEEQAALHALLADALLDIGREEEAWNELYQGFSLAPRLEHPRRAAVLYTVAAEANLEYDRPEVGVLFQSLALEAAEATSNKKIQLLALTARGLQLRAAGDRASARLAAAQARALLPAIADPASKERAAADLALLDASLDTSSRPRVAVERLTAAIDLYRKLGFQGPIAIAAYEERARLETQLGDLDAAVADLESSLKIYESRIEDAASGRLRLRWTLHRGAQQSYERLISLYLQLGDVSSGFATAERSRQFSLHSLDFRLQETLSRRARRPETIQGRLNEHEAVVLFKMVGDEIVTWLLDREGLHLFRRPLDRTRLAREIGELSKRLASRSAPADVRPSARHLADTLLPEDLLAAVGHRSIVLVPDEVLGNVPFGALILRDGSFLVERFTTVMAPSVTVLLEADRRQRDPRRPPLDRHVLLVSDPVVAREHWPELADLPATRAEGRALAALYPGAVHLSGSQATRVAFLREAPGTTLIHFAGHALVNQRRSDRSVLVLAPDGRDDTGAVYQSELYGLQLDRTPVVVLSACSTGTISGEANEGFSSLARAFLSSGATGVLASLWPVDDRVTMALVTSVHRELLSGAHPAVALRKAQLEYLRDEKLLALDPFGWAAFEVSGAAPPSSKETRDAL